MSSVIGSATHDVSSVVIANCYPDDNRGSAALNDAACVIAARAFPGARIALVSAGRSDGGRASFRHSLRDHPTVQVLPPLLRPTARGGLREAAAVATGLLWQAFPSRIPTTGTASALRTADIVLSRGGYVLFDAGFIRWWMGPYLMMLPFRLAHRLGTPTWTLPTSVIPPRGVSGALMLRHILRTFDGVAVRDPWAQQAAVELGGRRVRLYTDTAFVLSPPSPGEVDDALLRYRLKGHRFGVLTTRHDLVEPSVDRRKRELQAAAIRDLLARGEIDRVLVTDQTVGPELREQPSARELRGMIGDRALPLDGDFSHRDLMSLYARADVLLTQHLHSFIFATMTGTPALVFSTDGAKVEGLVAGLGLPSWLVINARVDDAREVKARLARLRSSRIDITKQMLAAAIEARGSIERLIRDLEALNGTVLRGRQPPR
jgi:polysaccharide pyruvyl transferase WcaK-like protein